MSKSKDVFQGNGCATIIGWAILGLILMAITTYIKTL